MIDGLCEERYNPELHMACLPTSQPSYISPLWNGQTLTIHLYEFEALTLSPTPILLDALDLFDSLKRGQAPPPEADVIITCEQPLLEGDLYTPKYVRGS